jgi:sortase (surface protein transpeptidase)
VIDFVKAIQNNDIVYLEKIADLEKIKKQPRHSYSIEDLRQLFGGLDIEKIECSKPVYDEQTKTVRVRMNQPISFDFDLKHQNSDYHPGRNPNKIIGGDFYKIISIHP